MASGKSSIGIQLANSLNLDFIDLDQTIEANEKMTVSKVFKSKGELYFRKKEGEVLNDILGKDSFVLSTGGGTPCYGNNMELILTKSTHSFYLKLSLGSLVERISAASETRPLVKDLSKEELPEFIGKHLFERSFFYTRAKHTLDCDEKEIVDIVNHIKKLL